MKLTTIRDGFLIATCAAVLGLAGLYGFEKYQSIQKDRVHQAEADVEAMRVVMPPFLMNECSSKSGNGYGGTDWFAMRSCVKEVIDSGEAKRVTLENERIAAEEDERIRKRNEKCRKETDASDGSIDREKYNDCVLRTLMD